VGNDLWPSQKITGGDLGIAAAAPLEQAGRDFPAP
jgi:hypothetical protein